MSNNELDRSRALYDHKRVLGDDQCSILPGQGGQLPTWSDFLAHLKFRQPGKNQNGKNTPVGTVAKEENGDQLTGELKLM